MDNTDRMIAHYATSLLGPAPTFDRDDPIGSTLKWMEWSAGMRLLNGVKTMVKDENTRTAVAAKGRKHLDTVMAEQQRKREEAAAAAERARQEAENEGA